MKNFFLVIVLFIGLSAHADQKILQFKVIPEATQFKDNRMFYHRILIPLSEPSWNNKSVLLICKYGLIHTATISRKTKIGTGVVNGEEIFDRNNGSKKLSFEFESCEDFVESALKKRSTELLTFDLNQDLMYFAE